MSRKQMHYQKPGTCFQEALPIGNGRMGAMIFGGVGKEKLILNESSMWSGSKENANKEDAHLYLAQIRQLLLQGNIQEAETIFTKHFTCAEKGSNYGNGAQVPFGCYQVLGELNLSFFQYTPFSKSFESMEHYERSLNLETAQTQIAFSSQGRAFKREALASAPDEAIVLRFSASQNHDISFIAALERTENAECSTISDDTIAMTGCLPNGKGGDGISYTCLVKASCCEGNVYTKKNRLYVENGQEAVLYITAATTMQGFVGRETQDSMQLALADLEAVSRKSWCEIQAAHVAYYQSYANAVELKLQDDHTDVEDPMNTQHTKTVSEEIFATRELGGSPLISWRAERFGVENEGFKLYVYANVFLIRSQLLLNSMRISPGMSSACSDSVCEDTWKLYRVRNGGRNNFNKSKYSKRTSSGFL